MLADAQSYNDIYGTTNNPWDTARCARRLVGRRGGGARRRAVGARRRQRHRRLVAQPGALLRRLRPQAELGADLDARPCAAGRHDADRHIGGRADGAPRRGPRPGAARPRRAGPAAAGGLAGRIAAAAPPPARRFSRRGVGDLAAVPDRPQRLRTLRPRRRAIAAPGRWSTIRRGPGSTTRRTTGCSCCCCARRRRRACATRISPAQQEIAATLGEDDFSDRAAVARGATMLTPRLGQRQRGAHQAAISLARILQAVRRVADAGRGDRRLPA